jgi:L-fucose isomerase-like protein
MTETALLFGDVPHTYLHEWQITCDLGLIEDKLGVRIEQVSQETLMDRHHKLNPQESATAAELAESLLAGATRDRRAKPIAHSDVERAARLYLAMRHFVRAHDATAVTVNCGPFIRGEDLPTPCVALTFFNDEGIPAACQGDLDALLTMILFRRASGLPSYMGGPIRDSGHLGVCHCVLSRRMCGLDAPAQRYYLSDYHGRKAGPTIHTDLPAGQPVTVARLTQNLESLLLMRGTVVASHDSNHRCRNTIAVEGPDRSAVLKAVKGVQTHLVLACGDHTEALSALADEAGIEVVRF